MNRISLSHFAPLVFILIGLPFLLMGMPGIQHNLANAIGVGLVLTGILMKTYLCSRNS